MQEITGESSLPGQSVSLADPGGSQILSGTTKYVEHIAADVNSVQNSTFLGLISGLSVGFAIMVPNQIVDPLAAGSILLGSGLVGILSFGASTGVVSVNRQIRKALSPLDSIHKKQSMGAVFKMMKPLGKRKTSVALGQNMFGEDMHAVVTSQFNNMKVEYIALPKAIEVWDKAMESLVTVHSLSTPVKTGQLL